MSSLQSSQRSFSAPHPLTNTRPTVKLAPTHAKHRIATSPLVSPHDDPGESAFHLDGSFFPRSNSYYSISTLPVEGQQTPWAPHTQPPPPPQNLSLNTTADSTITKTHLILSPTDNTDPFIRQPSVDVTTIVSSAAAVVTLPPLATVSLRYEHEHLIHSYDHLHTALCEKRRSATVPDLNKLRGGQRKGLYDHGPKTAEVVRKGKRDLVSSTLFSPEEEKVDYFGEEEEDGEVKEDGKEEDGSWTAYIVNGAKQFLVSPVEP